MFFLGKAFVVPYLLDGYGFLCVVKGENDYCLFVPEENLVNECVDDLLLQSVFRTVNLFELVEPIYYLLLCGDMCLCKDHIQKTEMLMLKLQLSEQTERMKDINVMYSV